METLVRIFGMTEAVWRRHAHPWSGWSRAVTGLPLIASAVWSRAWLGWGALWAVALVALWLWLNPRLFPEPARFDGWMSRGVMGEKVLSEAGALVPAHHRRAARVLSGMALPGVVIMGVGLWHYWLDWVVFGAMLAALPKFWFIDRMVWLVGDFERAGGAVWRDSPEGGSPEADGQEEDGHG